MKTNWTRYFIGMTITIIISFLIGSIPFRNAHAMMIGLTPSQGTRLHAVTPYPVMVDVERPRHEMLVLLKQASTTKEDRVRDLEQLLKCLQMLINSMK